MVSSEILVDELHALGIHIIHRDLSESLNKADLTAEALLIGLAEHDDARLRMMMIALFLYRPTFGNVVPNVIVDLSISDQETFKFFYTASVLLQDLYQDQLREYVSEWKDLKDYFSEELGLPKKGNSQERLRILGYQHRVLTGKYLNWMGTYQNAANRLLTRLEKETAWVM